MYQLNRRFAVLLFAVASTACGGAQLHQNRWREVQYAVRAAEDAGAENYPPAARLLESSREQIMRARSLADDGDETNAALVLDGSEADAQLALQMTRTKNEREQAQKAWAEVQTTELDAR